MTTFLNEEIYIWFFFIWRTKVNVWYGNNNYSNNCVIMVNNLFKIFYYESKEFKGTKLHYVGSHQQKQRTFKMLFLS